MNRGIKGEEVRSERGREGRDGLLRISRELTSAFLSMHNPTAIDLITRQTAFIGKHSSPFDRVDFAAFAHRRIVRDSRESDQCEVGYSVGVGPGHRRQDGPHAPRTDTDRSGPFAGRRRQRPRGERRALQPEVPRCGDRDLAGHVGHDARRTPSTIASRSRSRLRSRSKGRPGLDSTTFTTKMMMPILSPLTFGIPR